MDRKTLILLEGKTKEEIAEYFGVRTKLPSFVAKDDFDEKLSDNSRWTFSKKYLLRDLHGDVIETPKQAIFRLARTLAEIEKQFGASEEEVERWTEKFYRVIASKAFTPGGRVWTNAGTHITGLFNCYVLPVHDSLEEIYESVKHAALIQKHGGGTGYNFSELRPRGSYVVKSKGVASGVVSFIRQFDRQTEIINSGNRRGANMGILDINHPDILDFIYAKTERGEITNFNVSVGATEDFMRAVDTNGYFDLEWNGKKFLVEDLKHVVKNIEGGLAGAEVGQRPKAPSLTLADNGTDVIDSFKNRVIGRISDPGIVQLKADVLMDTICELAWRTGDPGMIFLDEINKYNPLPKLGPIKATNPCVARGTLVNTPQGYVPVEKIEIGDQISTVFGFEPVKSVERHDAVPVFNVKFSDGGVQVVTATHRYYAIKKGSQSKRLIDYRLDELKDGDYVRVEPAPILLSNPDEYLEGLKSGILLGDGCYTEYAMSHNIVKIASSTDDAEFNQNVKQLFGEEKFRKDDIQNNSKSMNMILSGGRQVIQQLQLVPSYSYEKTFDITIVSSREKALGIIDGLLATDGDVLLKSNHPQIRFVTSSQKLAQNIRRLLLMLGCHGRIFSSFLDDGGQIGDRRIVRKHRKYQIIVSGEGAGRLARMSQLEKISPIKGKKLRELRKEWLTTGNTWKAKIVSIEPAGTEEVYDLYCESSDTWITDGYVQRGCGEQPLHPYDACNLGSVNLDVFVTRRNGKAEIDEEKLREATRVIIRFMDNVNDSNKGPIPPVEQTVLKHRRIGLGVLGFADMLIQLGIPYDSDEALQVAEVVMKIINDEAKIASVEIAEEKGVFPAFELSKYATGKPEDMVRNAERTTIAPTGTISMIFDTSSGIEPWFGMVYKKNIRGGDSLYYVNKHLERVLKERGLYSKEILEKIYQNRGCVTGIQEIPEDLKRVFKTTFDVGTEQHVRIQAAFQKHVDNAVSKTINMPEEATVVDVKKAYLLAWKLALKGITIYRDRSKDVQVLETGGNKKESKEKETPVKESQEKQRKERKEISEGKTVRVKTPIGTAFVTLNFDDGEPRETFINVGKSGSDISADSEAIGRLISLCFRYGIPLDEVISQLKGIKSNPIITEKGWVYSLADGIAKALEIMNQGEEYSAEKQTTLHDTLNEIETLKKDTAEAHGLKPRKLSGNVCPDCGNITEMVEGCEMCRTCGFSKC
ncbi:MAG TPA: hypothetical protein HA282_01940 [Nanoarchaeota archaeon]|nr:MAG: ribonucleoside-diphosphate reductase alpha chain [archaeon GW2011_AR6]HIH18004.1 hypothetical protein [Nanoarchaeota archaeon]HIH34455.1 hypothetical protein [Nanoarchaeota archaeon]HIH65957.1 hypothetical protein [Nanoarchaeota archaeon]